MTKTEFAASTSFEILCNVNDITTEEWLGLRTGGIGGSDAGAILGMSKYESPLTVFMRKTKRVDSHVENQFTYWGKVLEPVIRNQLPHFLAEQSGIDAEVDEYPFMLRSTRWPWMLGNMDGVIWIESREIAPGVVVDGLGGLEIKTADRTQSAYWSDDQVPDSYYCQVQHYMAVSGAPYFVVACLLGKEMVIRFVPRNDAFISDLVEAEREFWHEYVQRDIMPAPTGLDAEDDVLLAGFREASGELELPHLEQSAIEYHELKRERDLLDVKVKTISQTFKAEILKSLGLEPVAEPEIGKVVVRAGRVRASWSVYEQNRIDTDRLKREQPDTYEAYSKPSKSNRLTIGKPKESAA